MKLHYRKLGAGKPLFILHGLFGSSDNWQTLAKKFAEKFEVYLVDQRNHGRSPHADEFDYWAMADDFAELIEDLDLDNVHVLGHSMGGKTVMTLAQQHPELLDKIIVADIGPKQYPLHHQNILAAINNVDLNVIKSRKEAEAELSKFIEEFGVKQFLLKNLYWTDDKKLAWRMNVPVLTREIHQVIEGLPDIEVDNETLFIRGGNSNYILDVDIPNIKHLFPNSDVITIQNAGHWLHAEQPAEFYEIVMNFLS